MTNKRVHSRRVSTAAILTLAGLIIISALTAVAQSGRRVRKSTAIPVATPEASPTPTPRKTPERPSLPVFLGVNAHNSDFNVPLYFRDSVAKSCAERLSARTSINVELSSRDLTRGEAIKRAKGEKRGFVVLLELRSDRRDTQGRNSDFSRVFLEYAVFAAGTGKQVTVGNVYQNASTGDIIVGRSDSISAAEFRLKQAARAAAERILAVLVEHQP